MSFARLSTSISLLLAVGVSGNAQPEVDTMLTAPTVSVYAQSASRHAFPVANVSTPLLRVTTSQTLIPALNTVPGLFMQQGALNTNRLSIRGVGSRIPYATGKVRAYIDEIPLTDGAGVTTIEDIDPAWLQRLEIIKGPQSGPWGTTLGGVVRLRTALPTTPRSSLSTLIQTGSFGTHKAAVQWTKAPRGRFAHTLGLSWFQSDGFRQNSNYTRGQLLWLRKTLDDQAEQTTLLLATLMKAYIPSSLNASDFAERPHIAASNWAAVRGHEAHRKLLIGHTWRRSTPTLIAMVTPFMRIRQSWEVRPFNILAEETWIGGLRTHIASTVSRPLQWQLGGEWIAEDYTWRTYEQVNSQPGTLRNHNRELRGIAQLYAIATWRSPKERFYAAGGIGLTYARFDYRDLFFADTIDWSASKSFGPSWSPQALLRYHLTARSAIHLNIKHGLSLPTIEESRRTDGTITSGIRPEQGWNFELGLQHRSPNAASLALTIYQMSIRDLLVTRQLGPDLFEAYNAGRTQHRGIEFTCSSPQWRQFALHTMLALSDYTFVHFVDNQQNYSGNKLTGWPTHTAQLWLSFTTTSTQAHLRYERVGAMPMRDDNTVCTEAYGLLHLRIDYELPFGKRHRLKVFAEGNNLTNTHYASMIRINAISFGGRPPRYYYPGLPRHWNLGLKLIPKRAH